MTTDDKMERVSRADQKKFQREVRGLEADFLASKMVSERRAWRVASISMLLALISLGLVGGVIHRQFNTFRSMPPAQLSMKEIPAPAQIAAIGPCSLHLDRYWIALYVKRRETYDFYSKVNDETLVRLMSSPKIEHDYIKRYIGPSALDKVWRDKVTITVSIVSVDLDAVAKTARVHYQTVKTVRTSELAPDRRSWTATLAYMYHDPAPNSQSKLINPQGFYVTSFSAHQEVRTD